MDVFQRYLCFATASMPPDARCPVHFSFGVDNTNKKVAFRWSTVGDERVLSIDLAITFTRLACAEIDERFFLRK